MIVFIDTNILGLISNENTLFEEAQQCKKWFSTLLRRSVRVITSDLCTYEEMRGLLSSSILNKEVAPGIKSLEFLRADGFLEFLPVSTEALDLAAELWARASARGTPTQLICSRVD